MNDVLTIGGYTLPVILVLLTIAQYLALRVRDTRATPPDPHLGRKSALYFFVNLSVLLGLIGLTVSSLDWAEYVFEPLVQAQQARNEGSSPPNVDPATGLPVPAPPRDWFNDQQRTAAGLVVSGVTHGLLFWLIARFATNDRSFPAVRRAFAGMRFVVCALVVMATSTITLVMAFQKGETDYRVLQVVCAVVVVWAPAALAHLSLLQWSSGWRNHRLTTVE